MSRVFRTLVEAQIWLCSAPPNGEPKVFSRVFMPLRSFRKVMSRNRRMPQFVPATCRSLAAANMSTDLLSGNASTARVLGGIQSRLAHKA